MVFDEILEPLKRKNHEKTQAGIDAGGFLVCFGSGCMYSQALDQKANGTPF